MVILAAVALEGFLNELEHHAEHSTKMGATTVSSNLARVLDDAEREGASPLLKLDLAHLVLTGTLPIGGSQPYQDIQLLFTVRNLLVHRKPEVLEFAEIDEDPDYPKIVKSFVSRGVIPPPTDPSIDWCEYVLVPSVAAWAYNTTVTAMQWIAGHATRDSLLKVALDLRTSRLTRITP